MDGWYIKEFVKLTESSVKTLYYYDKIGLLKPSLRKQDSAYRIYSEADLLKYQQIFALKFFGFNLSQIKEILVDEMSLNDSLNMQSKLLAKKSQQLLEASKSLEKITSYKNGDLDATWQKTIESMKVYTNMQKLEATALGKILDDASLKKYAHFNMLLATRFDEEGQYDIRQAWFGLMQQVADNLLVDPTTSEIGMAIGQQISQMANVLYGPEYASLKVVLWEDGFMGGNMADKDFHTTPEILQWIDLAIRYYWLNRLVKILFKVGIDSNSSILAEFNKSLTELYSDDQAAKDEAIKRVRQDDRLSSAAQDWLDGHISLTESITALAV